MLILTALALVASRTRFLWEVNELSTANVTATNAIAKNLLASLKSGVFLKGTVRSHSTYGPTNIAWIAVEFPAVGERLLPVKTGHILLLGREVVIECVPNPCKPGHCMFQLAGDQSSSAIG